MPFSREQFEVTQYLGNMIGKKDKFLNSIACMSQDWRLIRSYLELLNILEPLQSKPLTEQQKKKLNVIKEAIERIGQADWKMDVVSHLSMKIGKAYKVYEGE